MFSKQLLVAWQALKIEICFSVSSKNSTKFTHTWENKRSFFCVCVKIDPLLEEEIQAGKQICNEDGSFEDFTMEILRPLIAAIFEILCS